MKIRVAVFFYFGDKKNKAEEYLSGFIEKNMPDTLATYNSQEKFIDIEGINYFVRVD